MSVTEELDKLREEVQQLQISKLELIRATSSEIEKLRQTIRFLSGNTDLKKIHSIQYQPLSQSEINYVKERVNAQHPPIDPRIASQSQYSNANSSHSQNENHNNTNTIDNNIDHQQQHSPITQENNYNEYSEYDRNNQNNNNNNNQSSNLDSPNEYNIDFTPLQKSSQLSTINEDEPHSDRSSHANSNDSTNSKNNNQYQLTSIDNNLSGVIASQTNSDKKINDRKGEVSWRLSIKRMSRQGFVFSDFGFMTTDFDQLSRGHTQWVNHVIHHPVQNGITISASNDSCIFFWRFRKGTGKEDLAQEKYDSLVSRYKDDHRQQKAIQNDAMANKKNVQAVHSPGEIRLYPLLKINTGLEIKGIAMSRNGEILACAAYDEEEEDGEPELELYYDEEQLWCFKQDHMEYRRGKSDRTIKRKIVGLPFPPIQRAVVFTSDSKFVFVAMESTQESLEEKQLEDDHDYELPEEPCTLCCVDITLKMVRPCRRINDLMERDEHIECFSISPDGQRIALGSNKGRLIVTGARGLTGGQNSVPEGKDAANLWRLWMSDGDDIDETDGGLSAMTWSEDSDWLITGFHSGSIRLWKKNKEPRLSMNVNKVVTAMFRKAKIPRKSKLFTCKWILEGLHIESVNSISLRGSLMVSGSDDGTLIVHDLCDTFVDMMGPNRHNHNNNDNETDSGYDDDDEDLVDSSPITLAKIERLHGGRMVTSVSLSQNYTEESLLIPSAGLFLVSSGADNIIHCLSMLDVMRDSIRKKYYKSAR